MRTLCVGVCVAVLNTPHPVKIWMRAKLTIVDVSVADEWLLFNI